MTISLTDNVIHLSGECPAEDAETLLQFLSAGAKSADLTGCTCDGASSFQTPSFISRNVCTVSADTARPNSHP